MQGDRMRARRWIILMMSAITACIMLVVIGGFGSAAGAAPDGTPSCATPTALPMETPATGTPGPSPTALPPTATATAPQIIGRLLGDAPATVTATASSTPLPLCTSTPAPTKGPQTTTPTAQAVAHSSAIPVASVATTSAAVQVVPTAVIALATAAPSVVPVPVSVQSAPILASVAAPSASSSSPTSSSSSSGPPPAAVGLPPPPPPGYAASVGNTPNSVGGAPGSAFPSAFGTPVVSSVRGNVVAAGAPSASFPGAPAAVRPAVPPGYAVGPTGTAVPVINPRAGHPRPASSAEGALLLGIVFMFLGAGLRRCAVTGNAAFARDVRTRYTASALLRSVRNTREG